MGFDIYSEQIVNIAFWTAIVIVCLALYIFLVVYIMHIAIILKDRHAQKMVQRWTPIVRECAERMPEGLPPVTKRDLIPFLMVWNLYSDIWEGERKARLIELGHILNIERYFGSFLRWGSTREKLFVICTIGHMQADHYWDRLIPFFRSRHTFLSLAALEALVRINPPHAMQLIIPLIPKRRDWPMAFVGKFVAMAGPDAVTEPLMYTIEHAPDATIPTLIRLLAFAHPKVAKSFVRHVLEQTQNETVLLACLTVLEHFKDPEDAAVIAQFTHHPNWRVRVKVSNIYKHMGSQQAEGQLLELVTDKHWWVRYRAAQALYAQPQMDENRIRSLQGQLKDDYARDILERVVTEEKLHREETA